MKATRSKARQDVVNAAKKMPPLFHKLPNEDFDYRKSRTLWWLVKQPEVLKYIWDMVKQSGALMYDDKLHKWHGVDFKCEEEDDDRIFYGNDTADSYGAGTQGGNEKRQADIL